MNPKDEQMPRKYKGSGPMSPFDGYLSYWSAENEREADTAAAVKSNRSIKDIVKEQKETGKDLEVSGDALRRAKTGQPPKKNWDVAKDIWDSLAAEEAAKRKK